MPDESRGEFLTVAEVAELLRLNQQTVRDWVDDRTLPGVRVGPRRVRIRRSDLDAFLAAGSPAAGPHEDRQTPDPEPELAGERRVELGQALDRARAALGSDQELAHALRALADAAHRLADALKAPTG